jgi:hypothetical protein
MMGFPFFEVSVLFFFFLIVCMIGLIVSKLEWATYFIVGHLLGWVTYIFEN